jgi:predicted  nucleic acid-binding Zn-ribbon protein
MSDAEITKRLKVAAGNVALELDNAPHVTGVNVGNLGSLWEEFLGAHLKKVDAHGKSWLEAKIKLAEDALDKEVKRLNSEVDKLKANEKKQGQKEIDAKQKKEKDLKNDLRKLERDVDNAERDVDDQKDKIENTKDKTKKKSEKSILAKLERELYAAQKAFHTKEREINMVWAKTAEQVLKNLKDDQATLAKYKAALKTLTFPTL